MDQGTEKPQETKRRLAEFLRHCRYELIPLEGVEDLVVEHIPRDMVLTVTASPNKSIWATVELAERLSERGYEVAPHLSARLVRDGEQLEEILRRLREARIRDTFVVAGDAEEPVGEFDDAYALLVAMAEVGYDLEEVGISGYPEGHPFIDDHTLAQAMRDKMPYATYVVSQICFDAEVTVGWMRQLKQEGVELPIRVGMPGSVNRKKLMRISARIGLGESARFLRKQRSWLLRLFLSGGYSPNKLIEGLEPSFTDPKSNIGGFHIYTFNELEKTEAWRRTMLKRLVESAIDRVEQDHVPEG